MVEGTNKVSRILRCTNTKLENSLRQKKMEHYNWVKACLGNNWREYEHNSSTKLELETWDK